MAVKRVVANVAASDVSAAKAFYGDVLGMTVLMDFGWIVTFAGEGHALAQLSARSDRMESAGR